MLRCTCMAISAGTSCSGQKTVSQWVEGACVVTVDNRYKQEMMYRPAYFSCRERERRCSVAVALVFSLSNDQGSFAGSPPHRRLVVFHSSPMDRTQRDLQLL